MREDSGFLNAQQRIPWPGLSTPGKLNSTFCQRQWGAINPVQVVWAEMNSKVTVRDWVISLFKKGLQNPQFLDRRELYSRLKTIRSLVQLPPNKITGSAKVSSNN